MPKVRTKIRLGSVLDGLCDLSNRPSFVGCASEVFDLSLPEVFTLDAGAIPTAALMGIPHSIARFRQLGLEAWTTPGGIGLPDPLNEHEAVAFNGGISTRNPEFPTSEKGKAQARPRDDGPGLEAEPETVHGFGRMPMGNVFWPPCLTAQPWTGTKRGENCMFEFQRLAAIFGSLRL